MGQANWLYEQDGYNGIAGGHCWRLRGWMDGVLRMYSSTSIRRSALEVNSLEQVDTPHLTTHFELM